MTQVPIEPTPEIMPEHLPQENAYIAHEERVARAERCGVMTATAASLLIDSVLQRFSDEPNRSDVSEDGKLSMHTPLIVVEKDPYIEDQEQEGMWGIVLGKEYTEQTLDEDSRLTFIAGYVFRLTGFEMEQLIGKPINNKQISATASLANKLYYNWDETQDYLSAATTVKSANRQTRKKRFERRQKNRAAGIFEITSKVADLTILEGLPPITVWR